MSTRKNKHIENIFKERLEQDQMPVTPQLWDQIQSNLPEKNNSKKNWVNNLAVAASISLVFLSGVTFWVLNTKKTEPIATKNKIQVKPDTSALFENKSTQPIKIDSSSEIKYLSKKNSSESQHVKGIEETGIPQELSQTFTVVKTGKEKKEIVLPDSSKVSLNKNSVLSYSKDFNKRERKVNLEGEAFFEVKKAENKRFVVSTPLANVVVTGTSFNVKAYEDEQLNKVQVMSGNVIVQLKQEEEKTVVLKAREEAVVKSSEIVKDENSDPNFLSWKDDRLIFKNTPLKSVVKSLEEYFGLKITVENPEILKCNFSGLYQNPDLESILDILAISKIYYEKTSEGYLLKGKGCKVL